MVTKYSEEQSSSLSNNKIFKLLFWNILCDKYSSYWKTAPTIEVKHKKWPHRYKLFKSLLSNPSTFSDLYCFVEVDKQKDLLSLINSSRTSTFASIYYPRPNTPLGICLIYNQAKFQVLDSYQYFLTDDRNLNFALCACLKEVNEGYSLAMVVTHLIAWDSNEDKRIDQVNRLMKCIENDEIIMKNNCDKVVVCGDFNANPDATSVKIMAEKYCSVNDLSQKDLYTIVIDTIDEGIKKLHFDYVFYDEKKMEVVKKNVPIDFLDYVKGIPNENFPSDHLYVQCEMRMID